jgi:hypothetical protein
MYSSPSSWKTPLSPFSVNIYVSFFPGTDTGGETTDFFYRIKGISPLEIVG